MELKHDILLSLPGISKKVRGFYNGAPSSKETELSMAMQCRISEHATKAYQFYLFDLVHATTIGLHVMKTHSKTCYLEIPAKVLSASDTSAANACMSTPSFSEMAAMAVEASPPALTSKLERWPRVLAKRNFDSFEYLPIKEATNPQEANEGIATYRSASKDPK